MALRTVESTLPTSPSTSPKGRGARLKRTRSLPITRRKPVCTPQTAARYLQLHTHCRFVSRHIFHISHLATTKSLILLNTIFNAFFPIQHTSNTLNELINRTYIHQVEHTNLHEKPHKQGPAMKLKESHAGHPNVVAVGVSSGIHVLHLYTGRLLTQVCDVWRVACDV
jgi:hypothetical protein